MTRMLGACVPWYIGFMHHHHNRNHNRTCNHHNHRVRHHALCCGAADASGHDAPMLHRCASQGSDPAPAASLCQPGPPGPRHLPRPPPPSMSTSRTRLRPRPPPWGRCCWCCASARRGPRSKQTWRGGWPSARPRSACRLPPRQQERAEGRRWCCPGAQEACSSQIGLLGPELQVDDDDAEAAPQGVRLGCLQTPHASCRFTAHMHAEWTGWWVGSKRYSCRRTAQLLHCAYTHTYTPSLDARG